MGWGANQILFFRAMRGTEFHIFIRENELFIDHKKKEQLRTRVNMILQKAGEIEHIRKSERTRHFRNILPDAVFSGLWNIEE